jgi:aspartate kinase
VLNARSIEYAKRFKVPLVVKSTFEDVPGTLIVEEEPDMEKVLVRGITFARQEAKVTVLGVPDKPGIAAELFRALAAADLNIDMIIQDVSESGVTNISFTVSSGDLARTLEVTRGTATRLGAAEVQSDEHVGKVSIVGIGMRSHVGVASRMFSVLSEEGINIQMITTSEIKTSVVIAEKYMELAVRALHRAFDLDQPAA